MSFFLSNSNEYEVFVYKLLKEYQIYWRWGSVIEFIKNTKAKQITKDTETTM